MRLEAVEDILLKDRTIKNWRVLDVGTGTGILGITSVKLGAWKAVCVDIDRKATDIANENVKINHVENQVEIINGDVRTIHEPFDLIIANLTAKILIKLCTHLISLMEMGGYLALAGIIEQDRNDIEEYFCTDLVPYKIITEKACPDAGREWICYALGRRGK